MPWSKLSYERTVKAYKDALNEIIEKNAIDSDMPIRALMVRAEIIKRDFTKRQMSILMGIYTFSYAFCKESAVIPKLQDFSLVGVGITKIKTELIKLEDMNVIHWDKENNIFTIKDYREWNAPYHSGFNDQRGKELYLLNLEHAGIDVVEMMSKLNNEV